MQNSRNNKYLAGFALALLVMLSPFTIPGSASAGTGISITPFTSIAVEVTPGETITRQISLILGEQDKAIDMAVDVMGFGTSADGSAQAINAAQDTSPYSARSFISVDTPTLHLEPGGSQNITATILVPSSVGDGGRYAIIYIHQQLPAGGGGTGTLSAFNIPVLLTVKGSLLRQTGKITAITTDNAVSGQPVEVFTTFQNTGNYHFKVKGDVTISNSKSEILDTLNLAITPSSVIPTALRQLNATFIPQGELPLGIYYIKSRVMLADGTVLDEVKGSFEVTKPYVPPPAPASITLTPGAAAILKTMDGGIAISFPQGAVISQVDISLRNYPLQQLPAPPANFNLATTCFRVDGLNGLLSKEATVTVKYTGADLDRAGGDASRLVLARWDEADSQWAVLDTKIDKVATTLTTQTNHLSIWAVMVSPVVPSTVSSPPSSAVPSVVSSILGNRPLIGGVAAGVIIIILMVVLLVRRRG